jgi:hypothetical protein
LDPLDGGRKVPFLERCAVAQGARFANKNRDVVQRIKDIPTAAKSAIILKNDLAVLSGLDALGIGADLDRVAEGASI